MILSKQDIGKVIVDGAINEIRKVFCDGRAWNEPYVGLTDEGLNILYPQPETMIALLSRTQYNTLKKYSINKIVFLNEQIVIKPAQGWKNDIEVCCNNVDVSGATNINLKANRANIYYDIWGSTIKANKIDFRLSEETHIVFKDSQLICNKLGVYLFLEHQIRWFKMMYKKDKNKLFDLFGGGYKNATVFVFEDQKYIKYELTAKN